MKEGIEPNKGHVSEQTSSPSNHGVINEGGRSSHSSTLPKSSSFLSRNAYQETAGKFSASGLTNWAKGLRINPNAAQDAEAANTLKSPFSLLSTGFGKKSPAKIPVVEAPFESPTNSSGPQDGAFGTFTKGFLDTSKNAMKAVQIKARHIVSQNKRRYQEGGFDLDMSYITENIIAMGFPAGDISSGILGYVEGFYRNHMEEVIKFFEFRHKDKYKVYNLCSERLYDASLFEGKVACFPFDDHNCPPLQLISAFCQSAYTWLKGDLENVVVVHCKAGMARTGLMISSLLLYLKFFPTAEESISYYNQKRCVDGKGLVLPSQVRYVKYFERVLRNCDGETPTGHKAILRGFRLHKCPYWIRPSITLLDHNGILFTTKKHPRTKDLMPEDYWFNAPRKGIMVFALPGERGLADLNGDFKIHFHDRHGDFYCWLNTNMMESRTMLTAEELDGFDKRRLPSPGFQVEVVILDSDSSLSSKTRPENSNVASVQQDDVSNTSSGLPAKDTSPPENAAEVIEPPGPEKDDIFSDSESEKSVRNSRARHRGDEGLTSHDAEDSRRAWINPEQEVIASTGEGFSSMVLAIEGMGDVASNARDRMKVPQEGADAATHEASRKSMGFKEHVDASLESQHGTGNREDTVAPCPREGKHKHALEKVKLDVAVDSSDFKAIAAASAADASVFTFGDDEDYESEEE